MIFDCILCLLERMKVITQSNTKICVRFTKFMESSVELFDATSPDGKGKPGAQKTSSTCFKKATSGSCFKALVLPVFG